MRVEEQVRFGVDADAVDGGVRFLVVVAESVEADLVAFDGAVGDGLAFDGVLLGRVGGFFGGLALLVEEVADDLVAFGELEDFLHLVVDIEEFALEAEDDGAVRGALREVEEADFFVTAVFRGGAVGVFLAFEIDLLGDEAFF